MEMEIEFLLNMNVCYSKICCRISNILSENFMRISFSHTVHNSNSYGISEAKKVYEFYRTCLRRPISMEHIFIELYEHTISFKVILCTYVLPSHR